MTPVTPSSSLRDKILAEAAATKSRTRSEGRRRAVVVYTVAALGGLPLFFYWGGFGHAAGRPISLTIGLAAGALLVATSAASVAWWRGKSQVGRSQNALLVIAILVPIATYVWMVSWHGRYAEPFERVGYRCFAMTIASGSPLLFAALWLRKRTIAVHPVAGGAALGAAAGAFGGITVDLWCPLTNSAHVLVGHVMPIVLLAFVGMIAGRFVLAIRPMFGRR
ncbi:MAG TPA: NrsF family protein [Polyangiaceae bacterium]|nr:NrsF family protein [Polyangiaceae bacterium]